MNKICLSLISVVFVFASSIGVSHGLPDFLDEIDKDNYADIVRLNIQTQRVSNKTNNNGSSVLEACVMRSYKGKDGGVLYGVIQISMNAKVQDFAVYLEQKKLELTRYVFDEIFNGFDEIASTSNFKDLDNVNKNNIESVSELIRFARSMFEPFSVKGTIEKMLNQNIHYPMVASAGLRGGLYKWEPDNCNIYMP